MENAKLGSQCPDPKGFGCAGTVCRLTDVTGSKNAKHPEWLMCDKCKARFDESGRYADPYAGMR